MIASCDSYQDLWEPFFHCFRSSWPECPFPIYLLTNTLASGIPGVCDLKAGPDRGWSANLGDGLARLSEPYVLLLLEDLLLLEQVDHTKTMRALGRAIDAGANCLKLNPLPPPDQPFDPTMGIVSPKSHYRVSTVATLWKKTMLAGLLRPGETAWDFERKGSVRSDAWSGFYACWKPHLPVTNAVVKGLWRPPVLRRVLQSGAPVDQTARLVMGSFARWSYFCARAQSRGLALLPVTARRTVRSAFGAS